MASEVIEAKETLRAEENQVRVTKGAPVTVSSVVIPAGPQRGETAQGFTRDVFERALDKVSRPLKGRFAHVPYSSDDLIRDKREEVELEDRQP